MWGNFTDDMAVTKDFTIYSLRDDSTNTSLKLDSSPVQTYDYEIQYLNTSFVPNVRFLTFSPVTKSAI